MLSLSLGVVNVHPEQCAKLRANQLAALTSETKHQAKAVPGYSLHIIDTQVDTAV